jgi:hypothetical protein
MLLIKNITSDVAQLRTLILPDGSSLELSTYYMPMQTGWFITSLVYGNFTLNGFRIVSGPNMLYQWKNRLPFGLACFGNEPREPTLLDDFSSGSFSLFLLTADEVRAYQEYLNG